LLYLITMVSSLTFSGTWGAAGAPLWLGLLQQAALVSFTAVPIALGFAVLKYRLYDIDVVINHTLVYGSLTEMLALVYLGSVVMLQGLVRALTGQESTLAVAACSARCAGGCRGSSIVASTAGSTLPERPLRPSTPACERRRISTPCLGRGPRRDSEADDAARPCEPVAADRS
jgi:hypothetical protein